MSEAEGNPPRPAAHSPEEAPIGAGGFRVAMMYHPSHHVTDLDAAERWFARVFGRSSTNLSATLRGAPTPPGRRMDYSLFTPINDVLFDTIDPKLYLVDGIQRYPTVDRPHLKGFGWYIEGADGVTGLYQALKGRGYRIIGQNDEPAEGEEPPGVGGMPLFFTVPEDTGLRYEFLPRISFPLDPRVRPDWVLPPVSDDDPLGIERCSHHTVLTDRPERQLRLFVDVLGGEVFREERDETVGATGTYVHLADAVYEFAVPDEGTPAHDDWAGNAPQDTYHAITFKVADLGRVARHLEAEGVGVRTRTDHAIVTDPDTSLGVPWGFTDAPVPGDPRGDHR
ncbi:VOC family protein [Streptomyces sp. NPDC093085]|uniref:VOC family protein n=1 Tax=Streptomyces sp. NPDC093085 TaxID=3155068 RepID=UPI0034165C02